MVKWENLQSGKHQIFVKLDVFLEKNMEMHPPPSKEKQIEGPSNVKTGSPRGVGTTTAGTALAVPLFSLKKRKKHKLLV